MTMPWWPFYGRKFFGDEPVKMMSNAQIGMYVKLLDHQWHEGSIPVDIAFCAFMDLRNRLHDVALAEKECCEVLEWCFTAHPTLPRRLYNIKMDEVRQEQLAKDKVNQQRAKKASRAAWNKREDTLKETLEDTSKDTLTETLTRPIQKEIKTEIQIKKENKKEFPPSPPETGGPTRSIEDWFEEWWKAMPAKNGKRLYKEKAREFYERFVQPDQREAALAAAKAYAKHCLIEDRKACDPFRFLYGQRGQLWRDFIPNVPVKTESRKSADKPAEVTETPAFCPPPPEALAALQRLGLHGPKLHTRTIPSSEFTQIGAEIARQAHGGHDQEADELGPDPLLSE